MTTGKGLTATGLILLSAGLGACTMTGSGDESRLALATPGPTAAPVPDVAPPPPSKGAFLEGPIGSRLVEADRETAFKAEMEALSSGERKTWRGGRGTYGYVVPGASDAGTPTAEGGGAECRGFTHTIYFAGRPQTGHGTGCRDPDGGWRITG